MPALGASPTGNDSEVISTHSLGSLVEGSSVWKVEWVASEGLHSYLRCRQRGLLQPQQSCWQKIAVPDKKLVMLCAYGRGRHLPLTSSGAPLSCVLLHSFQLVFICYLC